MSQQAIVLISPEEIAKDLSCLTEKERCIVKGFIMGLNEAHINTKKQCIVDQNDTFPKNIKQ